jgi:hypothetical protein
MKKILIALLLFPFAAQAQVAKIPLITSAQDPSQLIGTINALTNAVNGLTIASTVGTPTLSGANTFSGINNFTNYLESNSTVAPYGIAIGTPLNAPYWMTARNIASGFPVPTMYPVTHNQGIALDLSPNGTAVDGGYGQAWSDICAQDVIVAAGALQCLHMSAGLTSGFNVGTAEYTSGTIPNLNLGTLNGDVPTWTSSITIVGTSGLVEIPIITTDATHTDSTVCQDTTTHGLYFGSGTAGICLGTSSARFKHDIAPLGVGLDQIMKLEPVAYKLNEDHGDPNKLLYGFTAEQGGKALPALAGVDGEGKPSSFDYLGVVPVLVKAMQEQQKEIDRLKSRWCLGPFCWG